MEGNICIWGQSNSSFCILEVLVCRTAPLNLTAAGIISKRWWRSIAGYESRCFRRGSYPGVQDTMAQFLQIPAKDILVPGGNGIIQSWTTLIWSAEKRLIVHT